MRFSFFLLLLPTLSLANFLEEITFFPSAHLDFILYSDGFNGKGSEALPEANGIFNTHQHDEENHGHNHGLERYLNFRGAELGLHGQGRGINMALLVHLSKDEAELEELWLEKSLGNFALKAGRFKSAANLDNLRHSHDWDFVDNNLPITMLLAEGLSGNGLQLRYEHLGLLPLTLGIEILASDNAGIAAQEGPQNYETSRSGEVFIPFAERQDFPRVWTAFARSYWDFSETSRLHINTFYLKGQQHQELHRFHPGINDADHGLEGDTWTAGLELGYQRPRFSLSASYFYQQKDLVLVFHELKPFLIGMPRELTLDSYQISALYRFSRRWQLGLRYETAGELQRAKRDGSPAFCPNAPATPCPRQNSEFPALRRSSLLLAYRLDDRQQFRFQVSDLQVPLAEDYDGDGREEAKRQRFSQFYLQYQVFFGQSPHDHGHAH